MFLFRRPLFLMLAFAVSNIFHAIAAASPIATPPPDPSNHIKIALEQIGDGLTDPVGLSVAGDGSQRLFIVEQAGRIRVLKKGVLEKKPFLDIRKRVASGGEKGLLGLAFHPHFSKNRRLFVNYTASEKGLRTVIAEFTADARLERVDPATERRLLEIPQPFGNHNGGQIAFGPEGMLYIGMGDGGAGDDPQGNGQNLKTLLGKMLRIDVDRKDGERPYAIPQDNPYAAQKGIPPEIWAYGLRNPWRFSFDSEGGDLYAGDVGQNKREEINIVRRGRNYGWNIMEGTICTPGVNPICDKSKLEMPIFDYPRSEGTVVIGGYVYRGRAIPGLNGAYLYGDYGNGRIWMLRYRDRKASDARLLLETNRAISAFGQDEAGELYVIDYRGALFKIIAQ